MINFAVVMKETNSIFKIIPNGNQTATLCQNNGDGIFATIGSYDGNNYHPTSQDLIIATAFAEGQKYTITSIEGFAFSNCKDIRNLTIGKDVICIEWNMYLCESMQNIYVQAGNPVYHDKDGVLFKDKELIAFPQARQGEYRIPYGTRKIGSHAFKTSKIHSVILPESLQEIGTNAFYECGNLKQIVLPKSIKKVHINNNKKEVPIPQTFYLAEDVNRINPLTITDVLKLFPA